MVPDALAFAFEVLKEGTMAEGAKLEIEELPVRCYCRGCDRETALENLRRVALQAALFEVSARTGQCMGEWYGYLEATGAGER